MHPSTLRLPTSPVLGRHHLLLETSAPDRAEDHLNHVFADHRLIKRGRAPMRFQHHHVGLGALAVNHLAYGAEVTITTPTLPDFYLLQVTLRGACRISDGVRTVELPPGAVFVMNPGRAYQKEWSEDSAQVMVRIGRAALELRASQEAGAARQVDFAYEPLAPGRAASLIRAIEYLCGDLREGGHLGDPGPRQGFSDMLLSLLLGAAANDQGRECASPGSPAAPYYVRRAEDYIREHALDEIDLSDIVAAAGVNRRTLSAGFRRFRQTTPMSRLRDVRLDRARLLLRDGRTEAAVTDVALACNFNHLGRFAQSYAVRFGERPSDTLRKALRS